MPNDAKIGLAVGVALVIAAAVLFKGNPSPDAPASVPADTSPAIPSPHTLPPPPPRKEATRHTVREGDTLTELARRYYGDRSLSLRIFDSNRDRLLSPDRLPPGTVLVIPDPGRAADRGRSGRGEKGVLVRETRAVAAR
jgi:nucleoid-associated protein YgaU